MAAAAACIFGRQIDEAQSDLGGGMTFRHLAIRAIGIAIVGAVSWSPHRGGNATYANAVLGGRGGADVCAIFEAGVTCTSADGEAGREDTSDSGNHAAAAAAIAAPMRPADPYAIAPVQTGRSERPTPQSCAAAADAQMNQCNDPRNNLGYEAHRACMGGRPSESSGMQGRNLLQRQLESIGR